MSSNRRKKDQNPGRIRNSTGRGEFSIMMLTALSLISTQRIMAFPPLGTLTSPDSPFSKVFPLMTAVGLAPNGVIPFKIKSVTLASLAAAWGTEAMDLRGKNGSLPVPSSKTDWGILAAAFVMVPPVFAESPWPSARGASATQPKTVSKAKAQKVFITKMISGWIGFDECHNFHFETDFFLVSRRLCRFWENLKI